MMTNEDTGPTREMTDSELLGCVRAGLDKLAKENVLIRDSADWALIRAELITLRERLQKAPQPTRPISLLTIIDLAEVRLQHIEDSPEAKAEIFAWADLAEAAGRLLDITRNTGKRNEKM